MSELVESASIITVNEAGEIALQYNGEAPEVVRVAIFKLQKDLEAMPGEKLDLPVKHTFLDGMYMRELFIPKGTLLVGKVHKHACMNIVSKGDISVLTESGYARVGAGYTVVSPAGLQKVGYAHEDTVFVNVFRTEETDPEKIEQAIAWDSFEAMALELKPEPLVIEGDK